MSWLIRFLRRARAPLRGDELRLDINEEFSAHIELETEERMRAGMTPQEARRTALRDFGGIDRYVEEARSVRGASWLDTLTRELRHAVRALARAPGFTAVAVLTLALGIGMNTAMFAVVNAVMLKPLPFANADRLMLVHWLSPNGDGGPNETVWSYPKYKTLTEIQREFESTALFRRHSFSVSGDGDPEVVPGEVITDDYFSSLGISPIRGRPFTADEAQRAGAAPVVAIGHGLWTRRYGASPDVVGRTIQIDGVSHSVVGVLPIGFTGLNGSAELWTPLAITDAQSLTEAHSHSYRVVARRRADVTESAVASALRVYGTRIYDAHYDAPASNGRASVTARSLYDSRLDADLRLAALIVLGAVACVLLIACVNLTNLLVVKSIARRREVAIRIALGAGRAQVARQLVFEGLILAGAGALAGLAVAGLLLIAAASLLPDASVFFGTPISPGTPRIAGADGLTRVSAGMIGFDTLTLAFTVGLALLTAVLVSILPAFQASAVRPLAVLKTTSGTASVRGFGRFGSRSLLSGAQIALEMVLLAGAGLMIRSASRLQQTNIGVDPHNVLSAEIGLPDARYDATSGPIFHQALIERVRALPGVESAGWGYCMPVSGGCNETLIWFPPKPQSERLLPVGIAWATAGYFEALRIPVVVGRNFTDADRVGRPKVALVNERAARRYWPGESAIGKRIAVGQGGFLDGAEVVGVVADVRYHTLETASGPGVFLPLTQSYQSWMQLVVRSELDAGELAATITREVRALDPNLPLVSVKTAEERIGDAMWRTRVAAWLLSAFAALALLLTAIGIFGVMAQTVAQRTPEIGIRMALGAQRGDVLRLVLGRAGLVTGIALAIGLAATLGLTRLLTVLLYEVTPTDPPTLVIVAILLGLVSLLACYAPARRATRVDAVTALRRE